MQYWLIALYMGDSAMTWNGDASLSAVLRDLDGQ